MKEIIQACCDHIKQTSQHMNFKDLEPVKEHFQEKSPIDNAKLRRGIEIIAVIVKTKTLEVKQHEAVQNTQQQKKTKSMER